MYSRNHDKLIFIFIDAKNNPESRKQILLQLIKNHSDISAIVNKGINHEIWNYPSQHTPHFLMICANAAAGGKGRDEGRKRHEGREVLSVSITLYFKSSGMSSQNLFFAAFLPARY